MVQPCQPLFLPVIVGVTSVSQWCDAVAKGLSGLARQVGSLETGFKTPPPTTMMISGQIL